MSTNAMDWPDSSCARPDIYFASLEGIIEACLLFVVSLAFFICVSNKNFFAGNLSMESHFESEGAVKPVIRMRSISLAAAVLLTASPFLRAPGAGYLTGSAEVAVSPATSPGGCNVLQTFSGNRSRTCRPFTASAKTLKQGPSGTSSANRAPS